MKIHILLRSPSVPTAEDFAVHMQSEQSIWDLKQTIERQHPAEPRARDMRIVWRGRVLNDKDLVRCLCKEESDAMPTLPLPPSDVVQAVVHFVLSTPMPSLPPQKASNAHSSRGKSKADGNAAPVATNVTDSSSNLAIPTFQHPPSVIPLGNAFQYVLVDGTPYLVELKQQQQNASQSIGGSIGIPALQSNERQGDLMQQLEAMREQLHNIAHANDVPNNRAHNQNQQQQWQQDQQPRQQPQPQQQPLAQVLGNLDFHAIWNAAWILLRMLLFVAVMAHDASMGRMLLLLVIVAGFVVLRSNWAQQQLMRLRQYNRHIDGRRQNVNEGGNGGAQSGQQQHQQHQHRQREFSALEKAKALVIALFTSLIPSEPFYVPAMEE
ncbi:hypothetical protein LPJ66_002065 [Kickxella alabastrina]|uniref:Uncharacterized protein n=1 Tax=Kickxella alabastrina TaxID=61397 RepID=A0ACC1IRK1_9FUNG|nr:hypothetical protein LPJ66_002065 [Kickxella alabastrina]